jgi:hypothetical protein
MSIRTLAVRHTDEFHVAAPSEQMIGVRRRYRR